jgi:hypothetical protein
MLHGLRPPRILGDAGVLPIYAPPLGARALDHHHLRNIRHSFILNPIPGAREPGGLGDLRRQRRNAPRQGGKKPAYRKVRTDSAAAVLRHLYGGGSPDVECE